jgi:hypothetical protein
MNKVLEWSMEYLKNKPVTDVLLLAMLAIIWFSGEKRDKSAAEAHRMVHSLMNERDDRDDRRTDKLISLLTGIKQEVRHTTAAVKQTSPRVEYDADVIDAKEERESEP